MSEQANEINYDVNDILYKMKKEDADFDTTLIEKQYAYIKFQRECIFALLNIINKQIRSKNE